MTKKNIILLSAVGLFAAIQFIQPPMAPQTAATSAHIYQQAHTPADVQAILQRACADCHSDSVHYPWYSYVAPVSWLIRHDVNEGREHFNLSQLGAADVSRRAHKLDEAGEEVQKDKMPLGIYTLMHPNAKLSEADKASLLTWFAQENPGGSKEAKNSENEGHEEHEKD
jgi:cytochrome c551/c552